jgi:transposase
MPKPTIFTHDQINSIVSKYVSGCNIYPIAKEFNVSENTIKKLLISNNISLRSRKESYQYRINTNAAANVKYTSSTDVSNIIAQYNKGATIAYIANTFKTSQTSIRTVLIKNNIKLKTRSEAKLAASSANANLINAAEDIINMYNKNCSINSISKKYNIPGYRIKQLLLTRNIHILPNAVHVIPKHIREQVIVQYSNETSINELSKTHNISASTIKLILKTYNVPLRGKAAARNTSKYRSQYTRTRSKITSTEDIKRIIDMYNEGYTPTDITKCFNVSSGTILKILKDNNIYIRTKSEAQRQHLLYKKKQNLSFQKYGVSNPMQHPLIFERSMKNSFRYKSITINGKIFDRIQGFEDVGIQYVLNTFNLSVTDIINGRTGIPSISYIDENGKKRVHFPDIYLPTLNTLIEVKSEFILNKNLERVLTKRNSAIQQGYKYIILVFNSKKQFLYTI